MIARIKGLKISQASERTAVTGQEMIPFQDGERNGKIRMIEFKDMTMYIFDPTIVDGKVSQEDYDALKQAIEEGKLIYTINSKRNGLDLATEVAIVGGTIYIESPDFIKEEGTDNISQVVFDTITVDGSLNYSKEQYTTTVIKTTGDGTKVLTDNGQYVYIGNLALTNIKFKDGTNTSTYDLVTNGITFRQNATPCVSWNTVKSGNNIYMDIRIANATASMDGLMSKEDYVELNTTIPGQIEDLKEADSNLSNRIDDLDDKIDKEIADREAEIDRIENKFDGVTDKLEEALQKEIEDRKAGDTTITNSLNAFISTKGQPGGLAELDSTGKVPAAQLPSYVDDVLEFSTKAQFPQIGETGKIYVSKDTNLTYRWTGTQYLEISQSLALGETPSTAYPGDKGKANRDALNSMPTKLTSYLTPTTSTGELVKINYKYAAKDGLNYGPLQDDNIDIPSATTTNAGAMSAIDKGRLDSLYNEFGSIQNPGDKLDSLPNNLVTGVDATSRNATSVTINYKQSDLSAASNSYANPITKSQTIPAATQSAAGVMTATDKQNLDVNIPNRITNLDNRVTTEVDRLEELIESSSSEITNDLNVEIQARKDGDNQLQTNINNLQSTMNTELAKKVGKVTVAGSGNAVTTASISGDTLTLTKGATYNNYVHPAGSAPSKAFGFYKFSTDSTSHVASVTAVTKADITALGIPAQNTSTTELDKRYSPYTAYNYDKGCLVKLRIPSNGNTMVIVRIFGNSYDSKPPFDTVIQFYNYDDNNEILQPTGVNNGTSFGDIKAFIHQGYVHLWFKQTRTYQTFHVHAYTSASKDNLVQSITNAAMPTSGVARAVTITPKQAIYAGDNIIAAAGSVNIENTNEINSYSGHLYLNHRYSSTGASTKNILMCANGGSVIIGVNQGNIAGDNKLYIGGNVASSGRVSAAGGFFKESDARLKSDIKPLDYTLDQICSIPTVSFIMNDQKQIGTVAQDLEELGFEDIVTESDTLKSEIKNPEQFESFTKDGEEYVKVKKVEYEMLGVLAIEGVKMLKDEIEKLKAEIETLKNKQHE